MDTIDYKAIELKQLTKDSCLPKTVEDQEEDVWLVKYEENIVGVGLYLPESDNCVMAILGDSEENSISKGSYGSSDEHAKLVSHGLQIAYIAYLRSIKGDTVLGDPPIDETLPE